LTSLLRGGNAHITFDDLIANFSAGRCDQKIDGLPYTAWQVLEHMRIAQWDILEFSRDPQHVSPKWPEGYWPKPGELGDDERWLQTVQRFQSDLNEMIGLIENPVADLFAKLPHGTGQTLLREALLLADHNAYHLGVLLAAERILKTKS
jgi:DinB superfamily